MEQRFLTVVTTVLLSAAVLVAQGPGPRGVVDRTQNDLRSAAEFERHHHNKELERYQNAERHLSDFDREFTKGHFDKGKLDTAIDDVKNVVDHNTLEPGMRDELRTDLDELRQVRALHDR